MRRNVKASFAFAFATSLLLGADAPKGTEDRPILATGPGEAAPGERLYRYLEAQARLHFDARRAALDALETPEDVKARQAELRAKFVEALGELPSEKTPLNARTAGKIKKDGYTVEKVVFESRPGHHVTANFYLPEGDGPFPGVLVPCGHSANGKAAETYQRISILLAKNGMAVLCYDPFGQGERIQLLDENGKPALRGSTGEHTMFGVGAWLVGRSAAGHRLWDGVRALDYLAGRPEVDPAKLGCTGNSGGGTMTAYLMAYDDRIAVAAPSCYVTSLERLFATIGPQDAEQNITGQVALGIEHADYVAMRAPKPTLLCVGTQDFFDIDGAWDAFREGKMLYGILGHGERVDLFESDEKHGFTLPRRQAAMRWMRRWLLGKDDAPFEEDFPISADEELQVTESGQVLQEYKGKSVFDLTAEKARELAKARAGRASGRTAESLRDDARAILALPEAGDIAVSGLDQETVRDGLTVARFAVTTEPGVTIPVLVYRPEKQAPDAITVVYVGAERSVVGPGGSAEAHLKEGHTVALIEPRGTGESKPKAPGRSGYGHGPFGGDEREAFLSIHLNRPLIGQRVFDVLQALKAIKPAEGESKIRLIGVGAGGPVALHVAALSDEVAELELDGSILSWTDVATTPSTVGQLANVVPGVLESYDLPDLAASLAPRPLTLKSPASPTGAPASADDIAEASAPVKEAYRDAPEAFRIAP